MKKIYINEIKCTYQNLNLATKKNQNNELIIACLKSNIKITIRYKKFYFICVYLNIVILNYIGEKSTLMENNNNK